MRRSRGKLSKFNWQLVLLAGIFQILTFVFDQIAIQNEEKLRINNFEILKTTESRSAFLRINNRVGEFLLDFENSLLLNNSSKISNTKKNEYFFENLLNQSRLLKDIISDKMIISTIETKTFEAADRQDPDLKMKNYKYEEYYNMLIEDTNDTIQLFREDPNFTIELDDGSIVNTFEILKAYVGNNNFYINTLLNDMAIFVVNSGKKLKSLVLKSSDIESKKQLMLLLGVVAQLLSLLFLLILFRRLLVGNL